MWVIHYVLGVGVSSLAAPVIVKSTWVLLLIEASTPLIDYRPYSRVHFLILGIQTKPMMMKDAVVGTDDAVAAVEGVVDCGRDNVVVVEVVHVAAAVVEFASDDVAAVVAEYVEDGAAAVDSHVHPDHLENHS